MENEEEVMHRGVVKSVAGDEVTVLIGPAAEDCGACAMAGLCAKPAEIVASMPGATAALVGKKVQVRASKRVQTAARLMLVLVPLVLVVMALVIGALLAWPDWLSGLAAVAVVAVWFVFLYLRRGSLRREVHFRLEPEE